MNKLLPVFAISIILALIVSYRDQKGLLYQGKSLHQERLFTITLILVLGIFSGLRTWYNDTITYIHGYQQTTPLSGFLSSKQAAFSTGFGFGFVNSLMKTLGASTQDFIMLYALATMALYITFLHRYSESFTFSIFLFFAVGCFIFAQAAIKQSLAMAIGSWSIHYAIEKKWFNYIVTVLLAVLFHPYAVVFLLVPLMQFRPWSIWGYIWVGICVVAGFGLESLLGTILDVTTMMGAEYDESSFTGEGVNVFRVAVCLVPTVITFVFQKQIFSEKNALSREEYLILNMTMMNGLIMFVGLFGTANYFARLANYFLPMQTLAIPWLANRFDKRSKPLFVGLCICCYSAYFYYQSGILQPFDLNFAQITLLDYLRGLF